MATARFGLFQFDPTTGELSRDGRPIRLQAQPAKLLAILIDGGGQLVTRETLRDKLWSDGTTVDFERGLNFAVSQVRSALGDSAEAQLFIRTVPKRGYQFVAPITHTLPETPAATLATLETPPRRRPLAALAALALLVVAALAIAASWRTQPQPIRIAVARFQNQSGDPQWDHLADTVSDFVVAGITNQCGSRCGVIGNAPILRVPRSFQDIDQIAATLKVQYVILGQIKRDGSQATVLAHFIRLPEKTHLKVTRINPTGAGTESQVAARIVDDYLRQLNLQPAAKH